MLDQRGVDYCPSEAVIVCVTQLGRELLSDGKERGDQLTKAMNKLS